jgi:para-nitrobenzyl esterase
VRAAAASGGADVPLIIGMNAHEHRLYVRPSLKLTDAALAQYIERRLGERNVSPSPAIIRRIIEHYHAAGTHPRNPNAAMLADIETELRFRRPMLRYAHARQHNTYLYQFDWPSPALGGWLGATHAVEIPFVFDNFDLRTTTKFVGGGPDAVALSHQIMSLWGHFARHGAPPALWPAYEPTAPAQLHLGRSIAARPIDADPTVAMWNSILAP